MARVFSIDIHFQSKTYTALVSVFKHGADVACQVRYVDEDLQYLLPGNYLEFSLSKKVEQPVSLPNPLAKNLVYCTTSAINAYLLEHT